MSTRTVLAAVALIAAPTAHAQLVWHTSRGAWDAARPAPVAWYEDFSGFAADRQFRTRDVAFAGGTLRRVGTGINTRNLVDVPALRNNNNNGTSNATMFVNAGGSGQTEIQVRMSLAQPVSALGFSTWSAANQEGVTVSAFSGSTLLGSLALGNGNGAFAGFVATGPAMVDRLMFSATTLIPGNTGEAFGLDDVVATTTPVPEPGLLLAFGTIALASRRRR